MSTKPATHSEVRILTVLFLTALASLLLAACIGSVAISPADLLKAASEFMQGAPASLHVTLIELRLQRALGAMVTGASLSLAGVLMQALLRNPLADPYVLGISGGAAVGALSALLCCELLWMMNLAAFGGAVLVAGLLFLLAYKDFRGTGTAEGSATTLLLTGVIISSGCMALITLLLSLSPDSRLRSMVFWMIGDLSAAGSSPFAWLVLLGVLIYVSSMARAINISVLYADSAATLGVSLGRLRKALFFCAALLTASAVANAGAIGFVGLIMPHACRYAWGPDHRLLLPASVLAGGSFLVLADTLARTLIAPQQLPVGVITALVGVPVFLLQLHAHRQHQGH